MATNYEILSENAISASEVLEIVKKKKKEKELSYREERISEYLKKNNTLSIKKFKDAKKELEALEIPRIEDQHIVKILEILPKNGTELRAVTSHSGLILVDETATKIVDVVKKYL